MPRFYFHVHAEGEVFPDHVGFPCESVAEAHGHALQLVAHVMALAPEPCDWRRWSVDVAAAEGRTALTVIFPCRGPRAASSPTRKPFGKRCA